MSDIPYVIEGEDEGERVYDLYSRLLKDRIVFVRGYFNDRLADSVVAQLLFLEAQDSEKDINLYINSGGGEISSMYAIYDTMNYIDPDIVTIGYSVVASAGSFILCAGTKGKRYALPNTEIMIHELSGGVDGKFGDIRNQYEHTHRLYEKMATHYSQMTGKNIDIIKEDMKKDFYMTPYEAVDYGLIDNVQEKR